MLSSKLSRRLCAKERRCGFASDTLFFRSAERTYSLGLTLLDLGSLGASEHLSQALRVAELRDEPREAREDGEHTPRIGYLEW